MSLMHACAMEYHKTRYIIHAKQILGYKTINNAMIYLNIEQALFQHEDNTNTQVGSQKR
ncbi:MAG: hypothetical protein OEX77_00830 [Candidatus Bathyarchaeota archaeon]|nr:hypothetical protein [Candidatus Bathyarchaeota archaeon]